MTDDIVEWLTRTVVRAVAYKCETEEYVNPDGPKAASEILRLRAENEKLREYMLTMTAERNRLSDALVFLRAENEKLRAALIKAGNGLLDADAKIKNMLAVLGSLIGASARLSIAAQTTGGVAGRDEGLCEAIDNLVQPLANARAAATALKETGDE